MSEVRIVSLEESEFPYNRAKNILLQDFKVNTKAVDFNKMIQVGKRIGWTEEIIKANQDLMERGKCFNFFQNNYPKLQGTLFEDNLFISFTDSEHEKDCYPFIAKIAENLGCQIV